MPRANSAYWKPKLARNVARDAAASADLAADGWTVIRAWEHEDPVQVAAVVERALAPVD